MEQERMASKMPSMFIPLDSGKTTVSTILKGMLGRASKSSVIHSDI